MHLDTPTLISLAIAAVGLLGVISAIAARAGVRRDENILEKGMARIAGAEHSRWAGGNSSPAAWLAAEALPVDSHFGDRVMSVWSGALVRRVPTLTELHQLSNGRERRRFGARLSGGITGLLVVSGIAGTLLCIHPILNGFSLQGGGAGAENAVAMIQSLGRAFWPSLTALLFTLAVAAYRGVYVHAVSKLAWKLDRFTGDVLFARFRVRDFGEEMGGLHRSLSALADRMEIRDRELGELLEKLNSTIQGLPLLKSAAGEITKAASSMAHEIADMRSSFAAQLGKNSPILKSFAGLADAVGTNEMAARGVHEAALAIGAVAEATMRQLEHANFKIGENFEATAERVVQKIGEACCGVMEAVAAATTSSQLQIRSIRATAPEHHQSDAPLSPGALQASPGIVDKREESNRVVLDRIPQKTTNIDKQEDDTYEVTSTKPAAAEDLFQLIEAENARPSPRSLWNWLTKLFNKNR